MLHHRWKITEVRNIANAFAKYLFDVSHDQYSKLGDLIKLKYERTFRFIAKAFQLEPKAKMEGFECTITGDGAEYTGKRNASQFCIGFKVTDPDAIDPKTGEPCFWEYKEDSDGRKRKVYRNAQSTNTCIPIGVCLQRESTSVVRDCFGDAFEFCQECSTDGLPASGGEPAFAPCKIRGCGDMCFLQKVTCRGGACKVKKHFCLYCKVHGDHDMQHVLTGEDRCDICKHNDKPLCPHRAVNDAAKAHEMVVTLLDIYLENFRKRTNRPEATMKDMLPIEPVECFA